MLPPIIIIIIIIIIVIIIIIGFKKLLFETENFTMNVWPNNIFATRQFYSFWWLLSP